MNYSDKPWVKRYDPGVPASLEPYPSHPLHQTLQNTAQRYPNNVVTITSAHVPVLGRIKGELTYRELDEQSDALASALLEMGVRKGDRIAIVMPNCAQFIIAFYAILKAGGVVCAMNPTYPPSKMEFQLKDCGAKIVITLSVYYHMLKQIQKNTDIERIISTNIKEYLPPIAKTLFTLAMEKKGGHRVELRPGDDSFQMLLRQYAGRKPNADVKPDDLALFQYTGGTTGVSKAAMATHQALVCNVRACEAWLSDSDEPQIIMAAIPLFHVFGMVSVMAAAVGSGSTMILLANGRDTTELLELIHTYKPQYFHSVPGMFNAINNHPGAQSGKYSLKSIRACISGSAPLPPTTKQRFEKLSGARLVEGFGMSEMPTATHVNPLQGENRTGSIGLPFPDLEARIISLEDDVTEMPVGEVGELVIRGPQMMMGYFNLPNETNNALREGPDGKKWLYTGDIARMDEDGYFYIVDRKKDMALIGGFNVYPNAVEKVLASHPAVLEVGVAAVPHPDPVKAGQESLKAWVVVKPDQQVTEKELIDYAIQHLARYEVPSRIAFVSELPKTTVGKVLRRELVQMELAALQKAGEPVAQS